MAPNLNQTELIYTSHIVTAQELPLAFLICVVMIFIFMCFIYIICCIGHFQGNFDIPYMYSTSNSSVVESIVKKFPKFSNSKRRKSKYPYNDVDLLNDSDFENYHTDSDTV